MVLAELAGPSSRRLSKSSNSISGSGLPRCGTRGTGMAATVRTVVSGLQNTPRSVPMLQRELHQLGTTKFNNVRGVSQSIPMTDITNKENIPPQIRNKVVVEGDDPIRSENT